MLTSTHASLASRSESDILISKSMRCSWHDPRYAAHWRWWPPLGWRMRRRGGRHGRWRLVGRRRGRRVSRGTAPRVSFLEARAIKSSSSSLAHRRNASASRPGSSSAISPTCATWRPRALAAGVGQRPPWSQHKARWVVYRPPTFWPNVLPMTRVKYIPFMPPRPQKTGKSG